MFKYVLKRLAYMLIVFIVLSFLMYMIYSLVPNNRAYTDAKEDIKSPAYKNLPENEREEIFQKLLKEYEIIYGTDTNSKVVRYLRWVGVCPLSNGKFNGILQGNFGYSYNERGDVLDVVREPMKYTIFINIFATILGLGITIPFGIKCAVKKGGAFDKGIQVFSIIGYSLPTFLIAIIFVWLFSWILPIFPASGMGTNGAQLTGFADFLDKLKYIILPLIVMTFCSLGGMTRYVRSAMIEALSMDCIRTARAKGLKEKTVIYSHAFRNALIPIITLVVGWFLGIFSGSLIIESIFGLNGMGTLMIKALQPVDMDLMLFLQMFYVIISLLGNLLIDLAYGLVDPRVRVNK